MLKWLVTKAPSSPSSLEHVITDDPLATLSRKGDKREPIYAVSRVNPIFEEDDGKDDFHSLKTETTNIEPKKSVELRSALPDSPPTDRESVRSSGYGSKEADSVSFKSDSQEDEDLGFKGSEKEVENDYVKEPLKVLESSPGNVAEIRKSFEGRSFPVNFTTFPVVKLNEIEIVARDPNFVESIEIGPMKSSLLEVIPESVQETEEESTAAKKSSWPRVSHLAQALQRQTERIHQRRERERLKHLPIDSSTSANNTNKAQVLRFNPLVSVVAQNRRYVTSIAVSPNSKSQNPPPSLPQSNSDFINENNFQLGVRSNNNSSYLQSEYPLLSLQPDSLVNEDTLCMMNYPEYDNSKKRETYQQEENVSLGELPHFGRAVYSGLYSSIKSGSSRTSQESLGMRERSLCHSGAKKKGVSVVKDLWEKTGLKTNGRKLLVDVNDILSEKHPIQPIPLSRRSSSGSTNNDRGVDILSHPNRNSQPIRKEILARTSSNKSSETYENIPSLPNSSSSTHSYEEISEIDRGIDNLAFIDDRGNMGYSNHSSYSKSGGHQFQHNLTEFQKRFSERIQSEPNHRKSWLDVEQGRVIEGERDVSLNPDGVIAKPKENKESKSLRNHPGRAVRELGLDGNWRKQEWKTNSENERSGRPSGIPWTTSQHSMNNGNETSYGSFGNKNRMQIWDQFYRRCKDGSIPGYFFPHPNSEAPIFAQNGGFLHDFTIDAKRSHRIQKTSSRSQRKRRCCFIFIILLAFAVFVGAIVGLSLFSTGGERVFGPM